MFLRATLDAAQANVIAALPCSGFPIDLAAYFRDLGHSRVRAPSLAR
jgi:hypothetical protein